MSPCPRRKRADASISRYPSFQAALSRRGALRPLPISGAVVYPAWQFALADVSSVMRKLLSAAEEATVSPLQLHLLLMAPAAGFDGLPLVEALPERLKDVAAVVSASNELGA